jgi:hypothetical protein
MRIQYTLPRLQPFRTDPGPKTGVVEPSFRSRLRRLAAPVPGSWRKLLRLDLPAAGPGVIAAPPKPPTMVMQDVEEMRLRWRHLLERQKRPFASIGEQPAGSELARVEQMLEVLIGYQALEDEVVVRHLSDSQV